MYKEQLNVLERFKEDLEHGWDFGVEELEKSINLLKQEELKNYKLEYNKLTLIISNIIKVYYNAYGFIEDTTGAEDDGICGIIRSNQVNLLIELLEELKEHEQEDFYISYEAMGVLKRYVLNKLSMEQVIDLAKQYNFKYIKLPQALLYKEYVKGLK